MQPRRSRVLSSPSCHRASIVKRAQIVRIEADVKTHVAKPKTIEEVLAQLE